MSCKHGGECLTDGVARPSTPTDTLRMLERLLQSFSLGDELFITARTHDSMLSMWRTDSKAAGLYWCASALAKLWRQPSASEPARDAARDERDRSSDAPTAPTTRRELT